MKKTNVDIVSEFQNLIRKWQHIIHKMEIEQIVAFVVFVIVVICLCIWIHHINVRKQYSDEAWKIRKKNGKKSIFWYDQYGNKVYKKPQKSNPPNRHKRGL